MFVCFRGGNDDMLFPPCVSSSGCCPPPPCGRSSCSACPCWDSCCWRDGSPSCPSLPVKPRGLNGCCDRLSDLITHAKACVSCQRDNKECIFSSTPAPLMKREVSWWIWWSSLRCVCFLSAVNMNFCSLQNSLKGPWVHECSVAFNLFLLIFDSSGVCIEGVNFTTSKEEIM